MDFNKIENKPNGSIQTNKSKISTTTNTEIDSPKLMDYISDAKKTTKNTTNKKVTIENKLNSSLLKNNTINVKYYCEHSAIPSYAHDGDLGMDIIATSVEYDKLFDRYIYHTGFYAETNRGDGCFIMPRSCNSKTEAYLCNSIGLVETFLYRGEFCVMFKNRTSMKTRVTLFLMELWNELPWYKKLFKSYNQWANVNEDYAQNVMLDRALFYAPYEIGNRIAQLVWLKFPTVKMTKLKSKDNLSTTERGEGGFGSTGK